MNLYLSNDQNLDPARQEHFGTLPEEIKSIDDLRRLITTENYSAMRHKDEVKAEGPTIKEHNKGGYMVQRGSTYYDAVVEAGAGYTLSFADLAVRLGAMHE